MRALKVVGWGFISSGLLIFAFLAYQLWGTTFVTARAQDQLEEAFQERVVEVQAELPPPPDPTTIRAAAGDIEGSVREPDEEPPRLVPEEA
ncbi:MAG: hypothetical protein M3N51_09820, partial [Actinomycetota bacterium]|nr:hypothetical protein [Actinomycetota bacterium]